MNKLNNDVDQDLGDIIMRVLPDDAEFILLYNVPGTKTTSIVSTLRIAQIRRILTEQLRQMQHADVTVRVHIHDKTNN